jgi:hypothetical protein
MKLNEIAGRGPRLLGFLTILLVGFLAVSCSNPTYSNGGMGSGSNGIPSPPAGGAPYKVTYYNYTVNTYGNPPVDSTAYAAGATVTVLGNVGAPLLTWTGFTFKGWNTMQTVPNNLDGGNGGIFYAPGATFVINSNVYLFGVWQ